MRRRILTLSALAGLAIAGFSAAPLAESATRSVGVRDDFFERGGDRISSLRARRGDVIRFVWRSTDNRHNVSGAGRTSSTTSRDGTVVRRRVRRSTTFICTVHPDTMRLRVRVR